MEKTFFIILLFAFGTNFVGAQTSESINPYANSIHAKNPVTLDGDTIRYTGYNGDITVRLYGIDCFESSLNKHIGSQIQKYNLSSYEIIRRGKLAAQLLENNFIKPYRNNIYYVPVDADVYQRIVGVLYYRLPSGEFVNINEEMKSSGYCPEYVYVKGSKSQYKKILINLIIIN